MRVKVLNRFIDKHTGIVHKVGEEFDCSPERFNEILVKGAFVEAIAENEAKALEDMTFTELKEHAKSKSMNIDGLKKKADILAAIKAAE